MDPIIFLILDFVWSVLYEVSLSTSNSIDSIILKCVALSTSYFMDTEIRHIFKELLTDK